MNLGFKSVQCVAFDEADLFFEMGFERFRDDTGGDHPIHRLPGTAQTKLYSRDPRRGFLTQFCNPRLNNISTQIGWFVAVPSLSVATLSEVEMGLPDQTTG